MPNGPVLVLTQKKSYNAVKNNSQIKIFCIEIHELSDFFLMHTPCNWIDKVTRNYAMRLYCE